MAPDPLTYSGILERAAEVAVLLFAVGLKLGLPLSDKRWHLPVRLAIVSMTITVALIAVLGMVGFGLSLGAAILLGSGPCEGLTLSDRDGDPWDVLGRHRPTQHVPENRRRAGRPSR